MLVVINALVIAMLAAAIVVMCGVGKRLLHVVLAATNVPAIIAKLLGEAVGRAGEVAAASLSL